MMQTIVDGVVVNEGDMVSFVYICGDDYPDWRHVIGKFIEEEETIDRRKIISVSVYSVADDEDICKLFWVNNIIQGSFNTREL